MTIGHQDSNKLDILDILDTSDTLDILLIGHTRHKTIDGIPYTAMKFWLRTIADIWSKVGVLWGPKKGLKSTATPLKV